MIHSPQLIGAVMEINGTYKGFSPTDESGVGMGEVEITITDDELRVRFATGLVVEDDTAPRSLLREMTKDEVAARFTSRKAAKGVTGFVVDEDGMIILFLARDKKHPEGVYVIVQRFCSDEIDGIFGPTFLFSPEQVEAGYFDAAIAEVEALQGDPGVIPRIANDGERL